MSKMHFGNIVDCQFSCVRFFCSRSIHAFRLLSNEMYKHAHRISFSGCRKCNSNNVFALCRGAIKGIVFVFFFFIASCAHSLLFATICCQWFVVVHTMKRMCDMLRIVCTFRVHSARTAFLPFFQLTINVRAQFIEKQRIRMHCIFKLTIFRCNFQRSWQDSRIWICCYLFIDICHCQGNWRNWKIKIKLTNEWLRTKQMLKNNIVINWVWKQEEAESKSEQSTDWRRSFCYAQAMSKKQSRESQIFFFWCFCFCFKLQTFDFVFISFQFFKWKRDEMEIQFSISIYMHYMLHVCVLCLSLS